MDRLELGVQTAAIGSLRVTAVGIGCNNFGRELDAEASRTVIHAAISEGINFFDTADTYGRPRTSGETILGEALRPYRDNVVIATKFRRNLDDQRYGAKPTYVRTATEASLHRLRTDYIDLMQVHVPDVSTPIEDTLGALGELVAEGKIREIGGSKYGVKELRIMQDAARAKAVPGFASAQAEYSLLKLSAADVVGECERTGVASYPIVPCVTVC
jgi:aryl-alcohol dehydrogenase-like predicted oxidoreductase